jgi:acetyl esterase/lipase
MNSNFLALLLSFTLLANVVGYAQTPAPKLVTWQDLMQLPTPASGQKIAYGKDSLQFGELRMPAGKGPFPVVVVIHGGCWLAQYNYQYMNHLSAALTKADYATWNLEFRRVGDPGGGWPGTFLDVGQGVDFVKQLARQYSLNSKKVVVMGHSAGGHLALWAAGRKNLPRNSELYTRNPLKVTGVVSLAGIPDLVSYSVAKGSCNAAVEKLMGGSPGAVPHRYQQGTPSSKLARRATVRLVQGSLDPIVPVSQASDFAAKSSGKGSHVKIALLPQAGHFDLVAPTSPVWPTVAQAVKEALEKK